TAGATADPPHQRRQPVHDLVQRAPTARLGLLHQERELPLAHLRHRPGLGSCADEGVVLFRRCGLGVCVHYDAALLPLTQLPSLLKIAFVVLLVRAPTLSTRGVPSARVSWDSAAG